MESREKRIKEIIEHYENRGINKENLNTYYRNILKLKYEKAHATGT